LSSFTHSQVVPNLYEFLCSAEHKRRYFEERLEPNRGGKNTMKVNGGAQRFGYKHLSKYLPLSSAE